MNAGLNWSRRYGPGPRRQCARPGCGSPAAATLRFQPTRREAWLVDLDADAPRSEGDLCARHAAGLVLPRGWELHRDLTVDLDALRGTGIAQEAPPLAARRTRTTSIARARRRRSARGGMPLPGLSSVDDPTGDPGDEAASADAGAEVDAEVEVEVEVEIEEVPADTAPAPAPGPIAPAATSEAGAELAERLDAQTPLLRRAFSNVWLPDADG